MSTTDYSGFLYELDNIAKHPPRDETQRRDVAAALRKAYAALEAPLDVVHRIVYSPVQLVVAKIAFDLGIFETLSKVEKGTGVPLDEIAAVSGAEHSLVARVLRFLAANGSVDQVTETTYAPNSATEALCKPGISAAVNHHLELQLPVWCALPSFLVSNSNQEPKSTEHTAFQVAHSTPLSAFQYAATKPKLMAEFAQWMAAQRQDEESWLKVMTHADLLGESGRTETHDGIFFVDVGGGIGHQSRALKAWLPAGNKERIVLQDLPPVVSRAGDIEGVETMPHNFFNEQPVKGAKYYYLRNVFHDYADEECRKILRNIMDAASPDSTIIIDELVLPAIIDGASAVAECNTSLDILLMASLAGKERTESEWRSLLEAEGLAIRERREYDHRGHSVLIVRRAS